MQGTHQGSYVDEMMSGHLLRWFRLGTLCDRGKNIHQNEKDG